MDDKAGRTYFTSVAHDGPLYLGMLFNVVALYFLNLIREADVMVALLIYAFVGSFANWLHHTFHIEGHWIERFVYFHDLRALHYTHHQGTAMHNYGFLDFAGDVATHSFKAPDYSLSNHNATVDLQQNLSSIVGDGSEHLSKVHPGDLPQLGSSGFKECLFVGVCYIIEGLVGLLGMIFGTDVQAAKIPSQSIANTNSLQTKKTEWDHFFLFS
jgi:hypothetical protein